jgi:hypothetical protein
MAELPISYHNLKSTPHSAGTGGHDGYRWHVGLKENGDGDYLVVDLGASAAIETGLSRTELDARVETALQRYAAGRLRNDQSVLGQVQSWNAPIVLSPEHFE